MPFAFSNKFIAGLLGSLALLGVAFWLVQSRAHFRDALKAETAAHQQTVTNYRLAAAQATLADAKHKAEVEAQQRAVNERTANEYQARIAAVRARYERLQPRAGTVASGPVSPSMSVVSHPASGSNPAPAQGGLSPDDALTATEQAIQLDELIKWVRQQTTVNEQPTK